MFMYGLVAIMYTISLIGAFFIGNMESALLLIVIAPISILLMIVTH